jgi:hypothetical protein
MVKDFNIKRKTTLLPATAVRRHKVVMPAEMRAASRKPILTVVAPAKPTQAKPTPAEVVMPVQPDENPSQSDNSYEVHSEGPLTYFDYYFDESELMPPKSMISKKVDKSVLFYRGVIGAGVLAATVASGLAIADALHKPNSEKDNNSTDSKPKQNSSSARPQAKSATPERLAATSFSEGRTQATQPLKPSAIAKRSPSTNNTTNQTQQSSLGAPLPPLAEAALLTNPTLLSNRPALPPLPARSTAPIKLNAPSTVRQVSPQRGANLPAISAPESFQPASALSPGLQSALQAANSGAIPGVSQPSVTPQSKPPEAVAAPSNPVSSGALGNASPANGNTQNGTDPAAASSTAPVSEGDSFGLQSGRVSPTEFGGQSPAEKAPADLASPAMPGSTPMPPTNEDGRSLNRLSARPLEGARNNSTINSAINNSPASNPASAATSLPEGIREYVVLGQKPAETRRVSLMPLTEKAAVEAVNTKQVGPFAVRQVTTQEYQKEWIASNPNFKDDPGMTLAFPAYGFIDYQRQVIVVLQEKVSASRSTAPTNS